ncbi:hypothetical protein BASA60_001604 [Batrachochytrium salamandrivorans]|nr:hypothetical protein BASA60_001604 [Batrachochytrium salamandrivorans]
MSAIPSMLLCCPSSSSSSSSPSTLSPSSSSPSSSAAALSPLSVPVSPMPTRRRRSLGRSSQLHVQGSRRYSAQRGAGMFRPSVSCSPNNNNPSNDNSGLRSSKIQRNRC